MTTTKSAGGLPEDVEYALRMLVDYATLRGGALDSAKAGEFVQTVRDELCRTAAARSGEDALMAFVRDVSEQKPEKPDYWCACGQCERNIDRAQEILEALSATRPQENE